MWKLEPRPQTSQAWIYGSPALALLITIVVAGMLFLALGKDPVRGLSIFLVEPWANWRGASEIALKSIPLVLCALGLALCYRSNVWNIGAEGQFLMGAIFAGGLAMWATQAKFSFSPWVFMWLGMLAGALGGAMWAGIVALLRDKFNANEILVSLMLVYVANLLLSYLVFGPWKDPQGFNFPQTVTFDDGTLLPRIVKGFRLHWGFVVALLAVAVMTVFLFRTFKGYQLQVGGLAPAAARYAGFSSRSALWIVLLTSGALAGIAGSMEALGPLAQLTPHVSVGYGFTAIIVAFIGRLHPVGCIFGAVLLSMFLIGGELAQSRIGLPSALSNVFQGVLLVALLACDTFIHYRIRSTSRSIHNGQGAKS
jgi:general nucleoside transport system permease protein